MRYYSQLNIEPRRKALCVHLFVRDGRVWVIVQAWQAIWDFGGHGVSYSVVHPAS